jgi:hypothetical protein
MSKVWNYFFPAIDGKAKCKLCRKDYSCKDSSTRGLWTHVKSIHKDVYEKDQGLVPEKDKARFPHY